MSRVSLFVQIVKSRAKNTLALLIVVSVSAGAFGQGIQVTLGTDEPYPGETVQLPLTLENPAGHQLGEFRLHIAIKEINSPALPSIVDVIPTPGVSDCGWEFFTFSVSDSEIVIEGKVDTALGRNCLLDSITLARLEFSIPDEMEYLGLVSHLEFTWQGCSDNLFRSLSGDTLYFSESVYAAFEDTVVGIGVSDSCLGEALGNPSAARVRDAVFRNGGVVVYQYHFTGDINIDGLSFTIADFVMFSNYFHYGTAALSPSVAIGTQQSNVNCDAHYLSLADRTFLARVILGDLPAAYFTNICDSAPYLHAPSGAYIVHDTAANTVSLSTTVDSISSIYVVFDGEVLPTALNGLPLWNGNDGSYTRVLFDMVDHFVQYNLRFDIPVGTLFSYTGDANIIDADVADWTGLYQIPTAVVIADPCCVNAVGNVNGDPADDVDVSDLTALVNHLFVTFDPLPCPLEAEISVNQPGTVDVSDLSVLVNHLFVTFEPLPACPGQTGTESR